MRTWQDISDRFNASGTSVEKKHVRYRNVNNHIHTPWSYSSFDSIDSIIEHAVLEDIDVVGINDFNTVEGYSEWFDKCLARNLFPIFNIEMTGLNWSNKEDGIRINDPINPGRIYLSGKALAYPLKISDKSASIIARIMELSNKHVQQMTLGVNILLAEIDPDLQIDYNLLKETLTRGMVRERHLAEMIRVVVENSQKDRDKVSKIFTRLLGSDYLKVDRENYAKVEGIIRSKLLKAGGAAFVEESGEVFLDDEKIVSIILDAGGIPTYPFLADFGDGQFTEFEEDIEKAAKLLISKGIYSVEFIPPRNNPEKFRELALGLYERGFIVTFGTEHNSPGIYPLEVLTKNGKSLDDKLLKINHEGASIFAAHQFLTWQDGEGYLKSSGIPKIEKRAEFIALGRRLIDTVCNK